MPEMAQVTDVNDRLEAVPACFVKIYNKQVESDDQDVGGVL